MWNLCNLFLIFIFIFIRINPKILWIQSHIFFCLFFKICHTTFGWQRWWRMWIFWNSKSSASGCCLAFALFFANFRLALLIHVLLTKKACNALIIQREKKLREENVAEIQKSKCREDSKTPTAGREEKSLYKRILQTKIL